MRRFLMTAQLIAMVVVAVATYLAARTEATR